MKCAIAICFCKEQSILNKKNWRRGLETGSDSQIFSMYWRNSQPRYEDINFLRENEFVTYLKISLYLTYSRQVYLDDYFQCSSSFCVYNQYSGVYAFIEYLQVQKFARVIRRKCLKHPYYLFYLYYWYLWYLNLFKISLYFYVCFTFLVTLIKIQICNKHRRSIYNFSVLIY